MTEPTQAHFGNQPMFYGCFTYSRRPVATDDATVHCLSGIQAHHPQHQAILQIFAKQFLKCMNRTECWYL